MGGALTRDLTPYDMLTDPIGGIIITLTIINRYEPSGQGAIPDRRYSPRAIQSQTRWDSGADGIVRMGEGWYGGVAYDVLMNTTGGWILVEVSALEPYKQMPKRT